MTDNQQTLYQEKRQPPIQTGTGYVNLESGDAYSGEIAVFPDWVLIDPGEDGYTIPRRNVDFINWKEV